MAANLYFGKTVRADGGNKETIKLHEVAMLAALPKGSEIYSLKNMEAAIER
ncbi:hypothetical protein [Halalkalibacterium halodurans]|uniref:hypothetical protein n=1 Tax=Halalkalibacterium halodurans TaxID=86665 RepID=UPI002AA96A70|nr:hypothetical protein [Halalkalibacterium halodurans]MDY7221567.1 hypothetical protein [Halalkalibacterium halodurans]MDY7240843.1 hypothetical protein [Halalkalibacterium halodurans]